MSARSKYDRRRDELARQFEEGYMNLVEYQKEVAIVNRQERGEIRRLAQEFRGMGMIKWP